MFKHSITCQVDPAAGGRSCLWVQIGDIISAHKSETLHKHPMTSFLMVPWPFELFLMLLRRISTFHGIYTRLTIMYKGLTVCTIDFFCSRTWCWPGVSQPIASGSLYILHMDAFRWRLMERFQCWPDVVWVLTRHKLQLLGFVQIKLSLEIEQIPLARVEHFSKHQIASL